MTKPTKELYTQAKDRFPEIEEIKHDLKSLKTNVIGLTKHVHENSADLTTELKEKVQDRLSKLQEKGATRLHALEGRVREKPAKAIAAAFAAGIVASWLFGGKK